MPALKKIQIKYLPNKKLDYIQIGGKKFKEGDGSKAPKPTTVIDDIIITEGSTCVWRRGRLYCR